jgi:hypothetical protein
MKTGDAYVEVELSNKELDENGATRHSFKAG